jgi:hypothetical protein
MARAIDPRAKAKRQKIIAIAGAVILVGLLAWRVPQMLALMDAKPPPGSNPTAGTPAPVAPAAPGLPVSPGVPPTSASGSNELADSDRAPVAGPGQLVSFGRFVSKDPFLPQTGKKCADDAGQTIACPTTGSASKPKQPSKEPTLESSTPPPPPASTKATATSVQISVNGATEGVSVGATFPTSDPVFKLISATAKSAKISIDGGSYASGESAITLKKGEPVTLVNTADGTRYRIVLR